LRAVALSGLCWASFASGHLDGPLQERRPASGSQDYYVYLDSLAITAGDLKPRWSPTHASYEIFIEDETLEEATLLMGIDFGKYRQFEQPHIFIDGERFVYSMLETAKYAINLKEDPGPLDRTIEIRVEDPKGPGPWYQFIKNRHFTYYLRVLQPPETTVITRAEGIFLEGLSRRRMVVSPPFDKASDQSDYTFHLHSNDTNPKITITCSHYATSLTLGGREIPSGQSITVDMSRTFRKQLVASCLWHDKKYSRAQDTARRTYSIHLVRDGEIKTNVRIEVSLLEYSQGACNPKAEGDVDQGWNCRVLVDNPDLLVGVSASGKSEPELQLIYSKDDTKATLYNLVPIEVRLAGGVQQYKLRLAQGFMHKDFPITFFKAETCSAAQYQCPEGKGLKFDADRIPCLSTTCTARDAYTCCAPLAFCSSFTSPGCLGDHPLRADAAKIHCKAIQCTKDDQHCCQGLRDNRTNVTTSPGSDPECHRHHSRPQNLPRGAFTTTSVQSSKLTRTTPMQSISISVTLIIMCPSSALDTSLWTLACLWRSLT
jgi:hypothetical protein